MRKGFTLVEVLIVVVIVGFLGLGLYVNVMEIVNARKCLRNGYQPAAKQSIRYCSKVENGNTIVVHVDSLK